MTFQETPVAGASPVFAIVSVTPKPPFISTVSSGAVIESPKGSDQSLSAPCQSFTLA
ncbi:MAG: hypothetical protein NTX92_07080 [Euryarchaeota archaeon]|nr:hypothetical protein [Euryarchaeota archaeon]